MTPPARSSEAIPAGNDLLRGSIDLVVLSVLADEPLYGYAIIKRVESRSSGSIRLTPGVLYPLLHQLEQQKLLLSTWEMVVADGNDDASRGRKRKWYRLSAKGRRRLAKRIDGYRAFQSLIDSFLSQPKSEGG